jgi:hypothetical protein
MQKQTYYISCNLEDINITSEPFYHIRYNKQNCLGCLITLQIVVARCKLLFKYRNSLDITKVSWQK